MKLPIVAIALFGYQINVADPLTFNQDRPLSTFENFYVSEIYQPTMNPSFLGSRIVETGRLRRATRPCQVCPENEIEEVICHSNENTKKNMNVTFINNTDIPVSAYMHVGHIKDNIGYSGYAVDAHSQKTVPIKEQRWVPTSTSDYKINERFQILNHALPNKLTIVIPNQKNQTFDIEQGSYTVIVSSIDNAITVQVRNNGFI